MFRVDCVVTEHVQFGGGEIKDELKHKRRAGNKLITSEIVYSASSSPGHYFGNAILDVVNVSNQPGLAVAACWESNVTSKTDL